MTKILATTMRKTMLILAWLAVLGIAGLERTNSESAVQQREQGDAVAQSTMHANEGGAERDDAEAAYRWPRLEVRYGLDLTRANQQNPAPRSNKTPEPWWQYPAKH